MQAQTTGGSEKRAEFGDDSHCDLLMWFDYESQVLSEMYFQ